MQDRCENTVQTWFSGMTRGALQGSISGVLLPFAAHDVSMARRCPISTRTFQGTLPSGEDGYLIYDTKPFQNRAEKHYLICDLADSGAKIPADREYRKWLIDKYNEIGFEKLAMFNAQPAMRMLAKIELSAAGKTRQVIFFTSVEDAEY